MDWDLNTFLGLSLPVSGSILAKQLVYGVRLPMLKKPFVDMDNNEHTLFLYGFDVQDNLIIPSFKVYKKCEKNSFF